jgi:chemotaxis protein histidine kinase CheA
MVTDWRTERAEERLRRFGEQARALATRTGKGTLAVEVGKESVRLVREAWAPFWANFTHVVRNAVYHGLEGPDERRIAGKREESTLTLSVSRSGPDFVVESRDDGRGIDWDAIADKARRAGLRAETQEDLVTALFHDGVTTAQEVSDVAGRGVGLGAVKQEVTRLGGHIVVESERGRGTTFQFWIPARSVSRSLRSIRPSAPPPRKTA